MERSKLKDVNDSMIFIENEQTLVGITEVHENILKSTVLACLRQEGIEVACEVNILLTDDASIRQVNEQFRNIDASTDVLSFPMANIIKGKINDVGRDANLTKGSLAGDIVISAETTRRQSEQYGHSLEGDRVPYRSWHVPFAWI